MANPSTISEYFSLYQSRNLTEPLIDDAIISHLNNVIGIFQSLSNKKSQLNESEVRKSLAQLKKVKDALQKINDEVSSMSSASVNSTPSSELIKDTIDMLRNGGKFTKSIHNLDRVERKLSHTSVNKTMTVSPCSFSPRNVKMSRKPSFTKLPKKIPSKRLKTPTLPRIVKTFYATCRIHRYSDNSHSFEIMQMKSDNGGDSHATIPEIVIVSLASGQTALFKSTKLNNSFLDGFPSNEGTDREC